MRYSRPISPPTESAPEVIALLETYLAAARQHRFGHVAIAMVGHPNVAAADFAGEIALELSQQEALGLLRARLDQSIANWSLPPRDDSLDAGHVCYNLANGPLGFDFLVWLVDAEMTRRRENAPGPLKVAFWLGRDAEDRINQDRRRSWLDNVFRPLLPMLGAVEDSTAMLGRSKAVFVTHDIVAAAKAGEAVPQLSLPGRRTHKPRPYVTITLRESSHWPHRNSNLPAWLQFAAHLEKNGERVVFVRDTERADEPLEGFMTSSFASRNMRARHELYERSKANLFVSNGPAALALFGNRPWLQFVDVESDGSSYAPNTARFWAEQAGVAPGEQYPWSRPDQRLVWAPDTFHNIMTAWNGLALA